MGWWKTRWRLGYRFKKLTQRAYKEAGVKQPIGIVNVPLWPKSFMDNFKDISFEKTHDFNFIGCINICPIIKENRKWVIPFAKKHFTERSYLRLNSNEDLEVHKKIGDYDHTFSYKKKRFVDKYMNLCMKRCAFDKDYYGVMCSSEFTLCPAGDCPDSDRFFETIMSKSIPILEKQEHCGHNKKLENIGYKFYLLGDDYVYRQDWVDYNYDLFLKTHTLFGKQKRI